MANFCAHRHPVQAVACPTCRAPVGRYCKRPSGHTADEFHTARKTLADKVFVEQHGLAAAISFDGKRWHIDPKGLAAK